MLLGKIRENQPYIYIYIYIYWKAENMYRVTYYIFNHIYIYIYIYIYMRHFHRNMLNTQYCFVCIDEAI